MLEESRAGVASSRLTSPVLLQRRTVALSVIPGGSSMHRLNVLAKYKLRSCDSTATFPKARRSPILRCLPIIALAAFGSRTNAQSLYPACSAPGVCGYVDANGQTKIALSLQEASGFSKGFARVKQAGHFGIIRTDGSYAIPADYSEMGEISEGYVWARKTHPWYWPVSDDFLLIEIASKASVSLPSEVTELGQMSQGLLLAFTHSSKAGYLNSQGAWAIAPSFAYAEPFTKDGLALTSHSLPIGRTLTNFWPSNNFDYIDKSGHVAFTVQGAEATSFANGLARLYIEGLTHPYSEFIDTSGTAILTVHDGKASDFTANVSTVDFQNGSFQLINRAGTALFATDFMASVGNLYDHLIKIQVDDLYGYITADGSLIIPPVLDHADDETAGYVSAQFGTTSVLFDTVGRIIWSSSQLPRDWTGCTHDLTAAPASLPAPDAISAISDANVAALENSLAQISGLPWQHRPSVSLIHATDAVKTLEAGANIPKVLDHYETVLLRGLGLFKPTDTVGAQMAQTLAAAEFAVDSESNNVVYVVEDAPPFWRFLSLIHALAHALARQNAAGEHGGDDSIRRALLEGIARLLTGEYVAGLTMTVDTVQQSAMPHSGSDAGTPFALELLMRSGFSGNWFVSRGRRSQFSYTCAGDLHRVLNDVNRIGPRDFYVPRHYWSSTLPAAATPPAPHPQVSIGAVQVNALLQTIAKALPSLFETQQGYAAYFENLNPLTLSYVSDELQTDHPGAILWITRWVSTDAAKSFAHALHALKPARKVDIKVHGVEVSTSVPTLDGEIP
jgi:hypothetical protein